MKVLLFVSVLVVLVCLGVLVAVIAASGRKPGNGPRDRS
jgi:hypothetical protein